MIYTLAIPMEHQLHTDYAKSPDQCLECQEEKQVQIEQEANRVNIEIDDAIEAQYHAGHGRHI